MYGGDGGSRTHVQKRRYFSVYERSPAYLDSLIVVPAGGPSESQSDESLPALSDGSASVAYLVMGS